MEDDGISTRRSFIISMITGAIILSILLFYPSETVSYNTADETPVEQETMALSTTTEPVATSSVATSTPVNPIPVYDAETERLLKAIAICESTDRHFDENGDVLMNQWGSSATGRYQIMASVWVPIAESMGIDIRTESGNKIMAHYILTVAQGISAWRASATCLAKHNVFIQ